MNLSWDSVDRKINVFSVDEYLRGTVISQAKNPGAT